jgi:hypothetical protein
MKTEFNPPEKCKAAELEIGDTISQIYNDVEQVTPFGFALVKNIEADGRILLFRPYGTTTDFIMLSGVICYIGIEEYRISSNTVVLLWSRQTLK